MRSAGVVAALFVVALFTNCGGDDNNSTGGGGGTPSDGGEGGTTSAGKGGSTTAGSSTAGKTSAAGEGMGGMPAPTGCETSDDCAANQECVETVCKLVDGEACTAAADCVNNCVDDVCTSLLPDGEACTSDDECAHTCIGEVCALPSGVGGDCDIAMGEGGAGGGPAVSTGGAGGEGGAADMQARDCEAPLQCLEGKCLTPDGEACTDNVDCLNTCVDNVCEPKGLLDGDCDDNADCAVAALVCDETDAKCKLDLLQQCNEDAQCESNVCICSNANCTVRTCKNPNAQCLCKWSPSDSAVCSVASANLNAQVQDPRGCTAADNTYCNQGQCVPNTGGSCVQPCNNIPDDPNTAANERACTPNGAATGCNAGYHPNVTASCAVNKAECSQTCVCELD
jgi:hypothetical protein